MVRKPANQQADCLTLALYIVDSFDHSLYMSLTTVDISWTDDEDVFWGFGVDNTIQMRSGWYDEAGECDAEMLASDLVHELYHATTNSGDDGMVQDRFGRGMLGHNSNDNLGCC